MVLGQNLLAPDVSRLIKLPVNLEAGRLDANLEVQTRPKQQTLLVGTAHLSKVTLKIPKLPKSLVQTSGQLGFKGTEIQLQNINTIYGQVPAQANGALDTQSGLNISVQTLPVGLKNLLNTFNLKLPVPAAGEAQANLKVTGLIQKPLISGTVVATKPAQIDRLRFVAIRAGFELVNSTLNIRGFQAKPAVGGQLNGSGVIKLGQNKGIVFDVQGQNLPGDTIAQIYGVKLPIRIGPVSTKGQVFGPTSNLQTVVQFSAQDATYPSTGEVVIIPGGKVFFSNTTFQVAGGTVKGSGQLVAGRWQASILTSDVHVKGLQPLIGRQIPPQLDGLLSGRFDLSGNKSSLKPSTIQGTGNARVNVAGGGTITASNLQLAAGRWQGNFTAADVELKNLAQLTLLSRLSHEIPLLQGRLSGSLNASGTLAAFNLGAISASGQLRLQNLVADGLAFNPLLTGNVNLLPGQGLNLHLAGVQDRIELALSPTYRPVSFFVKHDETIATGRSQGDRLLVRSENFPVSLLKPFAPLPPTLANQPLSGRLSGNFDINLASRSIVGSHLEVLQPIIGSLKGEKLTGSFQYVGGVATLTGVELQQGASRYFLNGSISPTSSGPQFQARLAVANGQLQDLLTTLQVFELQDLTRGFTRRSYAKAADISHGTAGLPNGSLLNQVRRLSEIEALLAQQRSRQESSPIPELRDLKGTFSGDAIIAGSLKQGVRASFDIQGQNWNWDRYKANQVFAKGTFEKGIVTLLPLRIESGETLLAFSGSLGGDRQSGQVSVQNLPVEQLQDFVNLPIKITSGQLNATATIAGSIKNPQAKGIVNLTSGILNQTPVQSAQANFSYADARLNFNSTALVAGNDPIQASGSVPYKLPFATLQAGSNQISLDLNVQNQGLTFLNLLTHGQLDWVNGQGQVQLQVRGTVNQTTGRIGQLIANGVAIVQNATLNAQALPGPLTGVNGRILFDFDRIRIDSLQGKFSNGQVVASGVIPISVPLSTDNPLNFTLNQLALNIKGRYTGGVNGNVVVTGTVLEPKVGGAVQLVNGDVLLEDTANATTPAASNGGTKAAIGSGMIEFNNLQISLGKGVQITRPPILNFLGTGNLTINGTLDALRPEGTVNLQRGQVNLFTTQFRLARGYQQTAEFLPDRGLVPSLDVRLSALVPETTRHRIPTQSLSSEYSDVLATNLGAVETVRIRATVKGPANQLTENLKLTSNPPRSEAEIVALLGGGFVDTLGRGNTTLGLANLAGSALLGNVQNTIGNALGLSEFRLFPTIITNPKRRSSTFGLGAEAGIDITPKLSASILAILTASQAPQYGLRYRVNDQTLLRGSTDFSGDSRLQVDYEKNF
ncbi:MAG: translocation/assembly module TamB domain-containing protein [Chamaesiphon sp.]